MEPEPLVTPRALLVDLDGTLYHARLVKLAMAVELTLGSWTTWAILRTFRDQHDELRRELADPVPDPYRLQLQRTAERQGCPIRLVEAVVDQWMFQRSLKWLAVFRRRGLLQEIRDFQSRRGCTALVSDYPARAKLRALRAEGLFDLVVANGEPDGPGRLKPWPDGYLMAAKRLGVDPRECVVLGDRVDSDGEAARRAGMAFRKIG